MLPTVIELPEDDIAISIADTFTSPPVFLDPALIQLNYPIDITCLIKYFFCNSQIKHSCLEPRGICSEIKLVDREFYLASESNIEGINHKALAMADVYSNMEPDLHSSTAKEHIQRGGTAEDVKQEGDREEVRYRDSESGRSGGEDNDRRQYNGRKTRGYRNFNKRLNDRKWWVCPDSTCRTRNSVDSNVCTNCGMAQERRVSRHPYARNWEKVRVSGLLATHVLSPTTLYMQTPQQQGDHARLRLCMERSYAAAQYRPSLVAAKMLLGVKYGDCYERVRTEERRDPEDGVATAPPVLSIADAGDGHEEGKPVTPPKSGPTSRVYSPSTSLSPLSLAPSSTISGSPSFSYLPLDSPGRSTAPPSGLPPGSLPAGAVLHSPTAGPQQTCPPDGGPPPAPSPTVTASPERVSSTCEWRVQLVDRGNWTWVKEDDLNFLLAGLSDLAPLAQKYTLNELKLKRDATESEVEESRRWLEQQLKGVTVDADIYKQTRDNSSLTYVDLYAGEKLLNREICKLGTVEPKTNLRWLVNDSRISLSSTEATEDGPVRTTGATTATTTTTTTTTAAAAAAAVGGGVNDTQKRDVETEVQHRSGAESTGTMNDDHIEHRSTSVSPESMNESKEQRQYQSEDRGGGNDVRSVSRTEGGGSGWRRGGGRRREASLPPLQDWAVLCFDQRSSPGGLRELCDLVVTVGKESRVLVAPPDSIRMEGTGEAGGRDMAAVLTDVIATHPRLLLLLCVLPHHVNDYSVLERSGRALGVCVQCIRGDSVAGPTTATASLLLHDMQTALLHSPAILPSQGFSNSGSGNNKRRRERPRRNQNRKQSASNGRGRLGESGDVRATTNSNGFIQHPSDPRLQAVIGAASQGIALLQKLSSQPGGQMIEESSLSPGMKSLLQTPAAHKDIAKSLESLESLQVSYKQARSYTHEAFQAAGNFFSHLSNAIAQVPAD